MKCAGEVKCTTKIERENFVMCRSCSLSLFLSFTLENIITREYSDFFYLFVFYRRTQASPDFCPKKKRSFLTCSRCLLCRKQNCSSNVSLKVTVVCLWKLSGSIAWRERKRERDRYFFFNAFFLRSDFSLHKNFRHLSPRCLCLRIYSSGRHMLLVFPFVPLCFVRFFVPCSYCIRLFPNSFVLWFSVPNCVILPESVKFNPPASWLIAKKITDFCARFPLPRRVYGTALYFELIDRYVCTYIYMYIHVYTIYLRVVIIGYTVCIYESHYFSTLARAVNVTPVG